MSVQGNYLAKAIATTPALLRHAGNDPILRCHADGLRVAQVFRMPDSGLIFASDAERFKPQTLRLPYAVTALEYRGSLSSEDDETLVLAYEPGSSVFFDAIAEETGRYGWVGLALWAPDKDRVWIPCAAGLISMNDGGADYPEVGPSSERLPVVLAALDPLGRSADDQGRMEAIAFHLTNPIESLIQLLCALECKNVRVEDVPAVDPHPQRKAHKKLPLISYKVLTLDTMGREAGPPQGGTHASPRTHLRRGHVRRLPSGNVWINATVVKGGTTGMVLKDYQIGGVVA